jgi:Ca-activated chloride channel family protein
MTKSINKPMMLSVRSVVFALAGLTFCLLVSLSGSGARAQQQVPDPRPRRADQQKNGPPTLATPTPTPGSTPDSTPEGGVTVDPEEVLHIDTSNVILNIRVIDRNNRPINDVKASEFHVFENGVPQHIESVSRQEVPISYGLAVDSSGSLRSQLPTVIDASKTIINSNKAGDETFLMKFVDREKIETLQDFTANKDDLMDAVDRVFTEGGQTAVIDAVYLAAEHVAGYKKTSDGDRRRRALILVTDGEDRSSYYKKDELFDRLREEDVQIYVIGFVSELDSEKGLIRKSRKEVAMALLDRIASETGGRVFYPNSISEIPKIADEITRDMRTQYVVSYEPSNKRNDGTYRAIKVTVADASGKDKRIALTRSGRTAPLDGAPRKQPPVPVKSSLDQRSRP